MEEIDEEYFPDLPYKTLNKQEASQDPQNLKKIYKHMV